MGVLVLKALSLCKGHGAAAVAAPFGRSDAVGYICPAEDNITIRPTYTGITC